MTLDELRQALAGLDLPGDTPVILQKDAEGNGYSPLAGAEEATYVAETTYSGEVYSLEDEEDGAVAAVVLWPVN